MRSALLISTYEMGRQPFGLASAAAWLRRDGWGVRCVDAAKEPLRLEQLGEPELIAFHLPMHTATRLAGPVIAAARRVNPAARICAFGLYAPLNAEWLRGLGADEIFGGEFEEELAAWANDTNRKKPQRPPRAQSKTFSAISAVSAVSSDRDPLPRIHFLVPDRTGLPPLSKYATLQLPDGERRMVGYTEASRGCRHLCRHCPVVPVYQGQFRVVQPEVVLADVAAQVAAGARHVTFGDPDFFNGPTHAMRIVSALHEAHPDGELRRHDQGGASAEASGPGAEAGGDRMRLRDQRDRVDRRRGAGAVRQGTHPRRFPGGGCALPGRRCDAGPDLRRLPPLADARGLRRPAGHDRRARPGRSSVADSTGHPSAGAARFAAARTRSRCARTCALSTPRR